ncbi:MAG: cytochrome c biogenesis protein ResB [Thermanaeromonas sp.]|nr:cytochrome c biogenesis protein ResB [Thermanaeromonas sp.]
MRLAIYLLLVLAALAAIGSLIPQGQPHEFYRAYYGRPVGELIIFFSLHNIYRSWWFISLEGLLAVNLLLCTVRRLRQPKTLKEWGSLLLHLSLLVILVGATLSGALKRSIYVEMGTGDSLDLASYGFPGTTLTVEDFKIEYYPTLEPKQYISYVTLKTAQGKQIKKEIKVNYPLEFAGFKIYQVSYGWLLKGQVVSNDKTIPFELPDKKSLPLDEGKGVRLFFMFLPDYDEESKNLKSRSPLPRNPRLVSLLMQGHEILDVGVVHPGETAHLKEYSITFSSFRYYTGLEIKKDPAMPVVYAGFILLLGGLAMRYISNHQPK